MGGKSSKKKDTEDDDDTGLDKQALEEKERDKELARAVQRAKDIPKDYPVKGPRIAFRYDSRPIGVALEAGYVAQEPDKAAITEGGENQNMVGAGLNYVGTYNYGGYSKSGLDPRTKAQWKVQGYESYYWVAVVVRSGGYTFEWLLENRISDTTVREKVRNLVLTRKGAEADKTLRELTAEYTGQGINNIGSTEIVTTKIEPKDILGYFEIRVAKGEKTVQAYAEQTKPSEIERISEEDLTRYNNFVATKGTLSPKTTFM